MAASDKNQIKISIVADSKEATKSAQNMLKTYTSVTEKMSAQFAKLTEASKALTAADAKYQKQLAKSPEFIKNMNSSMKAAEIGFDRIRTSLDKVTKSLSAFEKASTTVPAHVGDATSKAVAKIKKDTEDINKSMSTLKGGAVAQMLTTGWEYLGKAVSVFASILKGVIWVYDALLTRSSQMEQWAFSLRAIYGGSKELADQAMAWVRDFAAVTPHSTQMVVQSFRYLKAAGIEVTSDLLKAVGDASYAMNKDMSDTVTGFVSLETETLRRLGIVVERVGTKATIMSGNVRKVLSNDIFLIREAIQEMWEKRFPTAMKDAQSTFKGLMEQLISYWYEFTVRVGDRGVLEPFKAGLQVVSDWLGVMWDTGKIAEWGDKVGDVVAQFTKAWAMVALEWVRRGSLKELLVDTIIVIQKLPEYIMQAKNKIVEMADGITRIAHALLLVGDAITQIAVAGKSVLEFIAAVPDKAKYTRNISLLGQGIESLEKDASNRESRDVKYLIDTFLGGKAPESTPELLSVFRKMLESEKLGLKIYEAGMSENFEEVRRLITAEKVKIKKASEEPDGKNSLLAFVALDTTSVQAFSEELDRLTTELLEATIKKINANAGKRTPKVKLALPLSMTMEEVKNAIPEFIKEMEGVLALTKTMEIPENLLQQYQTLKNIFETLTVGYQKLKESAIEAINISAETIGKVPVSENVRLQEIKGGLSSTFTAVTAKGEVSTTDIDNIKAYRTELEQLAKSPELNIVDRQATTAMIDATTDVLNILEEIWNVRTKGMMTTGTTAMEKLVALLPKQLETALNKTEDAIRNLISKNTKLITAEEVQNAVEQFNQQGILKQRWFAEAAEGAAPGSEWELYYKKQAENFQRSNDVAVKAGEKARSEEEAYQKTVDNFIKDRENFAIEMAKAMATLSSTELAFLPNDYVEKINKTKILLQGAFDANKPDEFKRQIESLNKLNTEGAKYAEINRSIIEVIDNGATARSSLETSLDSLADKYIKQGEAIKQSTVFTEEAQRVRALERNSQALAIEQAQKINDELIKLNQTYMETSPAYSTTERNLNKLTAAYQTNVKAYQQMIQNNADNSAIVSGGMEMMLKENQIYQQQIENESMDSYKRMGDAYRELFVDSLTDSTKDMSTKIQDILTKLEDWATNLFVDMGLSMAASLVMPMEKVKALGLGDFTSNPLYSILSGIGIMPQSADEKKLEEAQAQAEQDRVNMLNFEARLSAQEQTTAINVGKAIVGAIYDTAAGPGMYGSNTPSGVQDMGNYSSLLGMVGNWGGGGTSSTWGSFLGMFGGPDNNGQSAGGGSWADLLNLAKIGASITGKGDAGGGSSLNLMTMLSGGKSAYNIFGGGSGLLNSMQAGYAPGNIIIDSAGNIVGTSGGMGLQANWLGVGGGALGIAAGGYGMYSAYKSGSPVMGALSGAGAGLGTSVLAGATIGSTFPVVGTIVGACVGAIVGALGMAGAAAAKKEERLAANYMRGVGRAANADISDMSLAQYVKGGSSVLGEGATEAAISVGGLKGKEIESQLLGLVEVAKDYKEAVETMGGASAQAVSEFQKVQATMTVFSIKSAKWSGDAADLAKQWIQVGKNIKELQIKELTRSLTEGIGMFSSNIAKLREVGMDEDAFNELVSSEALKFLTTDTLPALSSELAGVREEYKKTSEAVKHQKEQEEALSVKERILASDMELTASQLQTLKYGDVDVDMIALAEAVGHTNDEIVIVSASSREAGTAWLALSEASKELKNEIDSLASAYKDIDIDDVPKSLLKVYNALNKIAATLDLVGTAGDKLARLPDVFTEMTDALDDHDLAAYNAGILKIVDSFQYASAALQALNAVKLAASFGWVGEALTAIYLIIDGVMLAEKVLENVFRVLFYNDDIYQWFKKNAEEIERNFPNLFKWLNPIANPEDVKDKPGGGMTYKEAIAVADKYNTASATQEAFNATAVLEKERAKLAKGGIQPWEEQKDKYLGEAIDNINKAMDKLIKNLTRAYEDIINTAGMNDFQKALYNLDRWKEDQLEALEVLGVGTAEYKAALDKLNQAFSIQGLEIVNTYFDAISKSIADYSSSIKTSQYNVFANPEQMATNYADEFHKAQTEFKTAKSGDEGVAWSHLQQDSQAYLDYMFQQYGSSAKYQEAYAEVQQMLEQSGSQIEAAQAGYVSKYELDSATYQKAVSMQIENSKTAYVSKYEADSITETKAVKTEMVTLNASIAALNLVVANLAVKTGKAVAYYGMGKTLYKP